MLIIYYDDVEVTNPLGSSRGKHKLGIIQIKQTEIIVLIYNTFHTSIALCYYTLGNIRPSMRATLKTIQVVATVTYPKSINVWL